MAQNSFYDTALFRLRTCVLSSSFSVPLEVIFSPSEKEILVSKKAFVAFTNYGIITSNKQENASGCIGNRSSFCKMLLRWFFFFFMLQTLFLLYKKYEDMAILKDTEITSTCHI